VYQVSTRKLLPNNNNADATQTCTHRGFDSGQDDSDSRYLYTSPLIAILSTCSPLEQDPWMEQLVFDSIRLDVPDRDYTRYLWSNDDVLENDAAMD
jgi:hypothetical protein